MNTQHDGLVGHISQHYVNLQTAVVRMNKMVADGVVSRSSTSWDMMVDQLQYSWTRFPLYVGTYRK